MKPLTQAMLNHLRRLQAQDGLQVGGKPLSILAAEQPIPRNIANALKSRGLITITEGQKIFRRPDRRQIPEVPARAYLTALGRTTDLATPE